MSKISQSKKLYILTAISFLLIPVFFIVFVHIPGEYYTGFDNFTVKNSSTRIIEFIFFMVLLFHSACILWSTIHLFKMLSRKPAVNQTFVVNIILSIYPILFIFAIGSFDAIKRLKLLFYPLNVFLGYVFGTFLY